MPLRKCMAEHSEGDLMIWNAWFDLQMDRPSRSDFYLMQIALHVARANSKKPDALQLKDFQLRSEGTEVQAAKIPIELATAYSKAKWFGIVGITG